MHVCSIMRSHAVLLATGNVCIVLTLHPALPYVCARYLGMTGQDTSSLMQPMFAQALLFMQTTRTIAGLFQVFSLSHTFKPTRYKAKYYCKFPLVEEIVFFFMQTSNNNLPFSVRNTKVKVFSAGCMPCWLKQSVTGVSGTWRSATILLWIPGS